MKKMKIVVLLFSVMAMVFLSGCADTWNKADFKGGLFTSSKADYIVVSQSGGQIMDVWKLKDSFVSSPERSDGWIFRTSKGSIAIGGDAKVIRVNKEDKLWETYKEYHMEFEKLSYREKFNKRE